MIILIAALFFPFYLAAVPFGTLDSLQQYAHDHPEVVLPDNNDSLNPDFSSFHKSMIPAWWQRFFSTTGISNEWSFDGLVALLKRVVNRQSSTIDSRYLAERIEPSVGDSFIIWGDLLGAFHSLVRDLTYLNKQGILGADLKIQKKNYYFVFNGNALEGSPYSLETLTVIVRLMVKNPQQVIYTRGYSETDERWHNFEMMQQLKIRASYQSKAGVPFNDLFNRFFNALPVALVVTKQTENSIDAVIITGAQNNGEKFQNDSLGGLFSVTGKRGFFAYDVPISDGDKKVMIRAFISAEDRSVSYQRTKGLALAGVVGSAISWYLFSSPTQKNQQLYQFVYDAFAQLKIANGIEAWTLALFNEPSDGAGDFKQVEDYLVTSGRKVMIDKHANEQDLILGSTMDLSKSASAIGKKVREGLLFSFQKARESRDIPGIFPQVRIVDDEYTPFKTRAIVDELLKSGIDILIGSQGSASLEAYLDLIKEGKVLVLFPLTGAPLFRKPDLKNIIHYRGSYIQEGQELVRFALKDLKSKKIVIFYQDDTFGKGALEGAVRALRAAGITNYLAVAHERNATDFKRQVEQIKDFNPDTILFSTNSINIRALIRQVGVQYFAGKKLLGLSVYEDAFERYLKDKGLQFTIIRMVPDPATSDLEIAKEYRVVMDKNNLSYDKISFENFINANILFEIVRQIKGPVTKEKIIEVAESLKNYSFKGLILDFNPETRSLSDLLWIDTGQGPWIARKSSVTQKETALVAQSGAWQLGSIVDISGGTKQLGQGVKNGLELRLNLARDAKLANLPQITIVDDGYEPSKTRQLVEDLIKKGITTFICSSGSPTLQSYLDLIKVGDVALFFPVTGAPIARDKDLYNIINLRASYADEGRTLATYAVQELHAKKIVAFYQDDAFGKGLMDAGRAVLENNKDISLLEISYQRHQKDFLRQSKQLLDYNPDTILCFSTAIVTQDFLRQVGIEKAVMMNIVGNSDLGEAVFTDFAKDVGLKLSYVNVVPNPEVSDLPIVREYRDYAKKQGQTLDTFALESFLAMDVLLHVTQPMGAEITREAIIKRLMSFKDQEYKGLTLSFDPDTRSLLHVLWLNEGKPEWKMIPVAKDQK